MLKTKGYTYIIITSIVLLFTSCINCERTETVKTIESSGNETRERRYFDEGFDKISVNDGIEVIIEQSNTTEVTVITNENFQKNMITRVENGTLYLSSNITKTSISILGYKRSSTNDAATKKIIIKVPIINGLEANAASKIESKGTLKGNTIALKSSSASEINLNLEFEEINAECSSASKINLEGMALNLDAHASSASKIDADDLLVNTVTAQSSSASKISLNPIVNLKANASSGATIKYKKMPKHIEKITNSGGSIKEE
jgi:hypothetical protein